MIWEDPRHVNLTSDCKLTDLLLIYFCIFMLLVTYDLKKDFVHELWPFRTGTVADTEFICIQPRPFSTTTGATYWMQSGLALAWRGSKGETWLRAQTSRLARMPMCMWLGPWKGQIESVLPFVLLEEIDKRIPIRGYLIDLHFPTTGKKKKKINKNCKIFSPAVEYAWVNLPSFWP